MADSHDMAQVIKRHQVPIEQYYERYDGLFPLKQHEVGFKFEVIYPQAPVVLLLRGCCPPPCLLVVSGQW